MSDQLPPIECQKTGGALPYTGDEVPDWLRGIVYRRRLRARRRAMRGRRTGIGAMRRWVQRE